MNDTQYLRNVILISLLIFGLLLLQTAAQQCTKQSDIVFVMDQSGSIEDANPRNGSWDNWQLIKNFIIQIMTTTGVSFDGVHYGLVTFGNIGVIRFHLTDNLDLPSATGAVQAISPGNGQTNLYAGLSYACNDILNPINNARTDVPQIIIIVTDGFANINTDITLPQAQACQDAGIKIFAIGVTDLIDENQLKSVSSPPHEKGSNYWTVPDFTALTSILASVEQAACNPPKDILDGCPKVNLAILIDSSGSVASDIPTRDNIRSYTKRLIALLDVGQDQSWVAAVTYSTTAKVIFDFQAYSDKYSMYSAIDIMLPLGDNTDTAQGLRSVLSLFNGMSQIRPGVKNYMILLTDGRSNVEADQTIPSANALRAADITVLVVGVGITQQADLTELLDIAGNDQNLIRVGDYNSLPNSADNVAVLLQCVPTHYVCTEQADIALVLDKSDRISFTTDNNDWYNGILNVVGNMTESYIVSPDKTQFGLVKFADNAVVAFNLNTYKTNIELLTALNNSSDRNLINTGRTNLTDALLKARTQILYGSSGSRIGVKKILFLFTDGSFDTDQSYQEANSIKAAGAEIFTIGISNYVNAQQLKTIASTPVDDHFFYTPDVGGMKYVLPFVLSAARCTSFLDSNTNSAVSTASITPSTPASSRSFNTVPANNSTNSPTLTTTTKTTTTTAATTTTTTPPTAAATTTTTTSTATVTSTISSTIGRISPPQESKSSSSIGPTTVTDLQRLTTISSNSPLLYTTTSSVLGLSKSSDSTVQPIVTENYPTGETPLPPKNTGLTTGIIILIVVLIATFIIILVVVVICIARRRVQRKRKPLVDSGTDTQNVNNNEDLSHIRHYNHLQSAESIIQEYDSLEQTTEDSGYENATYDSVLEYYDESDQNSTQVQNYANLQPVENGAQLQPYEFLNQSAEESGYEIANEAQNITSGNTSRPNADRDQNPSHNQRYTKLQSAENRTPQSYESLNQPTPSNFSANNYPSDYTGSNHGYVEIRPESINSYASYMVEIP